jgi:hypothetical protein
MSALCQKETHAVQQFCRLFDNLIGAAKQRKRYGKAECLSGLQTDDEIDPSDLLNWKISRLLPFENPADVFPLQTRRFRVIGAVTD